MARRLLNIATWIGAVVGATFLIVALLCIAFGFSIVMFSTGSMAPTAPQGSLSLVTSIPASDIRIGDILTVDREGKDPITHRVIEINPGTDATERVIRMQGDANSHPDLETYTLTHARVQLFNVPGLGSAFQSLFGNPWLATATFLTVGALITGAFWPARSEISRTGDTTATGSVP